MANVHGVAVLVFGMLAAPAVARAGALGAFEDHGDVGAPKLAGLRRLQPG